MLNTRTRSAVELRPAVESLEDRNLMSTVILADIDTPSGSMSSWIAARSDWGIHDPTPLGNYLLPGFDCRGKSPVPAASLATNSYTHGTYMAARYALSLIQAGQTPLVETMIAGTDAGGFTSNAIGSAMIKVAQQQTTHNARHDGIRMVVALPVEPGIAAPKERQGRQMLAQLNVPISEAAGNRGVGFLPLENNSTLIAENADTNGILYPSSSRGFNGTVVIPGSSAFGTSGATEVGAAWLAMGELRYPGAPAVKIVRAVQAIGTLSTTPRFF